MDNNAPLLRSFGLLVLTVTVGCSGTLPEVGVRQAVVAQEAEDAPAPLPKEVTTHREFTSAFQACDAVRKSVPRQALRRKKRAYNQKQGGLLVTTAIGAAGSIATAALAVGTADDNGDTDSKGPAILGASTAGGTAVAGVISLFIVGEGAEEEIKLLDGIAADASAELAKLNTACSADPAAPGCVTTANMVKVACCASEATMFYDVPGAACGP